MAIYSFGDEDFKIKFSLGERRAFGRNSLNLDKPRILLADMVKFPEKIELGQKISHVLFGEVTGEYRSRTKKILVFGKAQRDKLSLKIRVSHPNVDEIWVCGARAESLHKELQAFIMPKGVVTSESN